MTRKRKWVVMEQEVANSAEYAAILVSDWRDSYNDSKYLIRRTPRWNGYLVSVYLTKGRP